MSPTSKPVLPNYTQNAAAYPTNIDAAINAMAGPGFAFAPHAQDTPNMTLALAAGAIFNGSSLTEVAAQSTSTIAAPTTNPRIDRVVVDKLTGVASVITGTPAASPSPPAITSGKLPVAQVLLTVGMTTITNSAITDERQLNLLGLGGAALLDAGANVGNVPVIGSDGKLATAVIPSVSDTDLTAMHALIAQIAAGRSTGPVPKGGCWLFATDEMSKASAYYDVAAKAYLNKTATTTANSLATGTLLGSAVACTTLDINASLSAGQLVSVQVYVASPITGAKVKVGRLVSGTTYSLVGESQAVNLSAGLNTITLNTPVTVQAGDMLGLYMPTYYGPVSTSASGSLMVINGELTTSAGFTGYTGTMSIQGSVLSSSATNMTLAAAAGVSLGFTPTKATIYVLHKSIDALTYNTDVKVKVANGGGGGWAYATDLAKVCAFDGTYDLLKAGIDMSVLPAGQTGYWGLDTYNTKAQQVRAALVLFQ